MSIGVRPVDIMDIVGGDQPNAQLARQFDQLGIGFLLFRNPMILNLYEKVFRAKNVDIFPGSGFRRGRIAFQNQRGNLAGNAGAQADQSFMMGGQQLFVDAGFIIKPFRIGAGNQLDQLAIPGLGFGQQHQMVV